MSKNSAINFSEAPLAAAAKALAIMVERFVPESNSCFYSATDIGDCLQGLQFGNSSALHADIDSMKMGLVIRSFRAALSEAFPGRFLFDRSQSSHSNISKGSKKFKVRFYD